MTEFILNNKHIQTSLPQGTTMLDFIRYEENLKGTKIGCREGDCGACTVLVGEIVNEKLIYRSMTSCLMPIGNAQGKHIVSVEGINMEELNPVQQAIVEEGGTQCGFCTVGFVMSLVGFCLENRNATYENAISAMDGNICRCTGYKSLERAAGRIMELIKGEKKDTVSWLVQNKFIPDYFLKISQRLIALSKSNNGVVNKAIIAGGTDLYVQKHDSIVDAELDFLFDNDSLKGIWRKENIIYLGASTTVEDVRQSELMNKIFPQLNKHLKLVSSTPIRNMATLAGNFVNASPIGDMTIFFLALKAGLILTNNGEKRKILLKDFYKGYKELNKSTDEIIETIFFEVPQDGFLFNFEKVSKRTYLDIASVNSAISIQANDNKIEGIYAALGGVYAFPRYLENTCAYLTGKLISAKNIFEANAILQNEIAPISDVRGSEVYKRLLARQLFFMHFVELFPGIIKAGELFENELA